MKRNSAFFFTKKWISLALFVVVASTLYIGQSTFFNDVERSYAAALTSTSITLSSYAAGATGVTATVAYTSPTGFAPGEKIRVTFDDDFTLTSVGASDGACSAPAGLTFSSAKSISNQIVMTLSTGGAINPNTSYTCTIANIGNPAVAQTTTDYTIETSTFGGTFYENSATVSGSIITSTGALTSTNVEPASLAAGTVGNIVVSFTTTNAVANNGKIKITLPSGFTINSGGSSAVTAGGTINGTAYTTIGVSGQVITLTGNGAGTGIGAAGSASITISQIKNPTVSGSTGTYTITTTNSSDTTIDTDASVTADTITAGALTSTNVQPASLTAGTVGNVVISFTTANAVANNGKIKITLPSGFAISSGSATTVSAGGTYNSTAYTTVGISSQVITLTGNGAGTGIGASGAVSITLSNIKNPTVSGSTGTYTITTTTSSDVTIDTDAAVTADTITAGALTSTNVEPASLIKSTTGTATISFTTANTIPSDGKIKVTFGAGFDLTSVGAGTVTCSTMDGFFSNSGGVGQAVTITRSGGTNQTAAAETCTITNVKNSGSTGSTGTYTITTTNSSDVTIDTDTAVAADTITDPAALSSTNVEPASLVKSTTGTTTVSFTTAATVNSDWKIKVTFGAGFDLTSVGAGTVTCSTMDGFFSNSGGVGQAVTITRSGGTNQTAAAETCTITNVKNSGSTGTTGTYSIQILDTLDIVRQQDTAVSADTIANPGSLTSTNVQPANLGAARVSLVTVSFTTVSAVANDSKIKITFPSGFDVSGINRGTCSTMDGGVNVGISGQVVTLTRNSMGTSESAAAESCTLDAAIGNVIRNPSATGSTGTYSIQILDSLDILRQEDTAVSADTITASLTSTNVEPVSLVASASGNVTVSFTTTDQIQDNGKIKITFPAGFALNNGGSTAVSSGSNLQNGMTTNNLTVTVSGQSVTLTGNGGGASTGIAASAAVSFTLSNIRNPVSSGSTGTYTIQTLDTSNVVQNADDAVAADTIITSAGALSSTNVQPASLVAGAVGNVVVSFTTVSAVANNGKIKVTLPSGFTISSGSATAVTAGATYNSTSYATVGVSGQVITLTGDALGTGIGASGAVSITLSNIKNPTVSGSTGTYTITTTNSSDVTIDTDAAVTADTITAGALTSTNVEPASLMVSASGIATVTFTTANAIPSDGKIKVTFGAGFNVAGANSGTCSTMDGNFATSVSNQVVTITRSAGSSQSAAAESCTISGIQNSASAGTTGTYTITTANSSNATIDTDAAVAADTILAVGALTSTNVQPVSLGASYTGQITVSFTTVNAIPATGKIQVAFPSSYDVSGASGGTCSTMDGNFATSVSGSYVTITRSAGTSQSAAAETCTINNIINPVSAGATTLYAIYTQDSNDVTMNQDTNVSGDTMVETNVEPASLVVGATGTTTVTFTTGQAIPSTGKIKVTFGAGYVLTSIGTSSGTCSSMDGAFSTSVSGQVVTITRSAGTSQSAATETCTIGSVTNAAVSGSTGVYTIRTTNSADTVLDTFSNVNADTIIPGTLISTNVQPVSLGANYTGQITVSFTTVNAIPTTGKIQVAFPAGYDVSGASGATCSTMDGNFATSVSGQYVTITRSAGTSQSAAAETCTINNIINPVSAGSSGGYAVYTTNSSDIVIDQDTSVAADTMVETNVEPSSLVAGASGTTTVTFTTGQAIPVTGKIKVTFGAGYVLTSVGASSGTCSSMDGAFSTSVSGQVVTITRSGGTSQSAAAETCAIGSVTNMAVSGSTGVYTIRTTNSADTVLDTFSNITADNIAAGTLTSTNVQPASLAASATGTVTVSFTTVNAIPATGKILVAFPGGYNVSGASGATCSTMDGNFATSVSGSYVTITRSAGTSQSAAAETCTINNIINPASTGTTTAYAIYTQNSSEITIDQDTAVAADTIGASGVLSSTNVQPASLVAGVSGTVTVSFTTVTAIASTGKIKVTFPSGFNVSAASGGTCSTMDGAFATSVSGQIVTITRSAGTSQSAAAESCTLASIVNPQVSGSTGTYEIQTTNGADSVVNEDTSVAADTITAGALTVTNVEPASLSASSSGNVTVTFTTANPIPTDGKIKITFGAGFNVASASGGTCSTMDGSFATSVIGQVVTITRSSGSSQSAAAESCTLSTITNPSSTGSTGTYTITTTNSSDVSIDTDTAVTADTITSSGAGALSSTNVEPASLVAGATGNVTISFTMANPLPATGKVKVTFPSGFYTSSASNGTCNTMDGTFSTAISGQTVTMTRSGGTQEPITDPQTCTLSNITNPSSAGSTGTYTIRTSNSADTAIDENTAVTADTITASSIGAITNVTISTNHPEINAGAIYTFNFTTATALAGTDRIKFTFPSGYNISGARDGTCTAMDGTISTNSSGTLTVMLQRSGGNSFVAGQKTCTVSGIVNPSSIGTTGVFSMQTTNILDLVRDQNTSISGISIGAAAASSGSGGSVGVVYDAVPEPSPTVTATHAAPVSTTTTATKMPTVPPQITPEPKKEAIQEPVKEPPPPEPTVVDLKREEKIIQKKITSLKVDYQKNLESAKTFSEKRQVIKDYRLELSRLSEDRKDVQKAIREEAKPEKKIEVKPITASKSEPEEEKPTEKMITTEKPVKAEEMAKEPVKVEKEETKPQKEAAPEPSEPVQKAEKVVLETVIPIIAKEKLEKPEDLKPLEVKKITVELKNAETDLRAEIKEKLETADQEEKRELRKKLLQNLREIRKQKLLLKRGLRMKEKEEEE